MLHLSKLLESCQQSSSLTLHWCSPTPRTLRPWRSSWHAPSSPASLPSPPSRQRRRWKHIRSVGRECKALKKSAGKDPKSTGSKWEVPTSREGSKVTTVPFADIEQFPCTKQ